MALSAQSVCDHDDRKSSGCRVIVYPRAVELLESALKSLKIHVS